MQDSHYALGKIGEEKKGGSLAFSDHEREAVGLGEPAEGKCGGTRFGICQRGVWGCSRQEHVCGAEGDIFQDLANCLLSKAAFKN